MAVAGVTVNGTAVLICCLEKGFIEGEGDGQHLLPLGAACGDIVVGVAEGVMFVRYRPKIHWFASIDCGRFVVVS